MKSIAENEAAASRSIYQPENVAHSLKSLLQKDPLAWPERERKLIHSRKDQMCRLKR